MRHRFDGFDSDVDPNEIDLVQIEPIGITGFSVVITTKGGGKSKRHFVAADPTNLDQLWSCRDDARFWVKRVERGAKRRQFLAKFLPHFWTWLASVATATGLTTWIKSLL